MSKEYDIDDILSEVKKRREENEALIRGESLPETAEAPAPEEVPDALPAEEEAPKAEPETADAPAPEVSEDASEVISEETPEEISEAVPEEVPAEEAQDIPAPQEDAMVDILSLAEEEEEATPIAIEETAMPQKAVPDARAKKKKTTKIVISAIAVLLVIAITVAAIFANKILDKVVNNSKETVATTEAPWTGMDKLVESFDAIDETEAGDLASLQDMIKTWYYNGTPCSSTHVLNIMLIGEDTRGTEILEENTRADSAIILSINIDTEMITLTSILRDAWAYWETTEGDTSTGQFGKINGAMSTGDINAYINCVEHLYKINIDNYAIVNFDSFEGIVDALGGVTLTLTDAEINEINSHQKRYGHVTIDKTFEGNKGKMKLTGKQALAYCRIRKLDSDNMRADRQKTCLIQIFKQSKKASTAKLLKLINKLAPYVKTSFSKNDMLRIARYAFSQGWMDFDIQMQNLPDRNLKGGSESAVGQWIWRPDYPADAYDLQMSVYGKSNITLAHIRPDTKRCPMKGFRSEGAAAMATTVTNTHYGEPTTTTTTTTTKKETSE